jgi:hypothetical protein
VSTKSLSHYESLATHILGEFQAVVTRKLAELKPELSELRAGFKTVKPNQSISGCHTWDEFCTKKLHRTKRAVNLLLATNPETSKPPLQREETSHHNGSDPSVSSNHCDDLPPESQAVADPHLREESELKTQGYLSKASQSLYAFVQHRMLRDDMTREEAINEVLDEAFPMDGFAVTKTANVGAFTAADEILPVFEEVAQ